MLILPGWLFLALAAMRGRRTRVGMNALVVGQRFS